eukprot:14034200-Alexandrium_andersonii.AAC.1
MPFTPVVGGAAAPVAPTVEVPTVDGDAPMFPVADVEAGVPLGELDVSAPRGYDPWEAPTPAPESVVAEPAIAPLEAYRRDTAADAETIRQVAREAHERPP